MNDEVHDCDHYSDKLRRKNLIIVCARDSRRCPVSVSQTTHGEIWFSDRLRTQERNFSGTTPCGHEYTSDQVVANPWTSQNTRLAASATETSSL